MADIKLVIKIDDEEYKRILNKKQRFCGMTRYEIKIANGTPLDELFINKPCISKGVCHEDKNRVLDKIRAKLLEEKECAYADFEQYKVEYLGQDWEDAYDSLPQDDFRYGMERCLEIIDECRREQE